MNSVSLRQKSWHYWLATVGGLREVDKCTDICTYTRKVIGGTLISFLILVVGLVLASSIVGTFAMWIYYHDFLVGTSLPIFIRIAAMVFYVIFSAITLLMLVAIFHGLTENFKDWRARTQKQPGFVHQAYRSFKDKVCWKINIS